MLVLVLCIYLAAMAPAETEVTMSELDPPYCAARYRRLCQGKGRHVACQFPTPGPGESCINYTHIKFNKDLRNFVTHYINRRRQRLASGSERVRGGVHLPRPEVMMQVEWDRELALLAQRLADQCSFVHDDCRATVRFPYAGQTVGEVRWRRTSESDAQNVVRSIRRVLDAWWGERRRVTARQLTQPFRLTNKGNVWGHFSQLAVWTLRAVGCGAVRHGNRYPKILLVCDFSHTNMLGQRTLVPGPLGACPIHMARKQRSSYPMLCAPVRYQEEDENSKSNNRHATADETNYDDESRDDNDDEDLDNNILFGNATLPPEPSENTVRTEVHRPHTYKRIRVNPWDETEKPHNFEQESDGNEISHDREYVKDKINDKKLIHEEQTEKLKSKVNEYTHHDRTKDRGKTTHEDETFEDDLDGISNDDNTGIYPVKNIRDRGKSRDKAQDYEEHRDRGKSREKAQEHEEHLDNYEVDKTDQSVKPLQHKEKIHEEGGAHDSDFERVPEKFVNEATKTYKIKRIRDRERGQERDESLERKRPPESEDSPEKQKPVKERPSGRERPVTKELPERERESVRKIPVDRPMLLEHSDMESEDSLQKQKPVKEWLSGRERPVTKELPERESARKNPVNRPILLEHSDIESEDLPEKQKPVKERPSGRQRPVTKELPEIERESSRKSPVKESWPRLLEHSDMERERQPQKLSQTNREKSMLREMVLERTPSTGFKANLYENREGGINLYKETTTERDRSRPYTMIKIDDIQKKQRNFLDLKLGKGESLFPRRMIRAIASSSNQLSNRIFNNPHEFSASNRQMEFQRIKLDPINRQAQVGTTTLPFEHRHPSHDRHPNSYNKFRVNQFSEYGASPRNLLEGLKEVGVTGGEPRRTQFYEPVGARHRWRPTKERPERPGARALMTNAFLYTTTRPAAPKKNHVTFATIMMDKDDVEQLFKDTGFNLGWKQYKKILT